MTALYYFEQANRWAWPSSNQDGIQRVGPSVSGHVHQSEALKQRSKSVGTLSSMALDQGMDETGRK